MALFTDGPPSSIDDLSGQDAQLLGIAPVEGIDVSQKLSLAWGEIGLDLYSMLNVCNASDRLFWRPPTPDLGAVVITPALHLWHTYRTLEMVYADAYNCQLNDRYAGKRDYFHERAAWARERLMEIGVGIVGLPLARAAKPTTAAVLPGGVPLPDGIYYAAMTWVNSNGEEGASSDAADVSLSGNSFSAAAGAAPRNAVGWNVYAGTDPSALTLQNASPLALGQTWVQPSPLDTAGRTAGSGQSPSYVQAITRMIQRG